MAEFDPEKVQRLHLLGQIVVSAADFDALLAAYRELDVALANAKFDETTLESLEHGDADETNRLTAKLADLRRRFWRAQQENAAMLAELTGKTSSELQAKLDAISETPDAEIHGD